MAPKKRKKNNAAKEAISNEEENVQDQELPIDISLSLPKISGTKIPMLAVAGLSLLFSFSKLLIDIEKDSGVRAEYMGGAVYAGTPYILSAIFLVLVYLASQSKGQRRSWAWGVPVLGFFTMLFSFHSNSYGFPMQSEYSYFSVMAAIFALFWALSYHRILGFEVAIIAALFLSTAFIHLAPARHDYLMALDPYHHLKWMNGIYDTGFPPEHDELVYPMRGGIMHHDNPDYIGGRMAFGQDERNTRMFTPVSYAYLALFLKPFGIEMYDVAMLFPAIIAAFTVVLMYLFVKELFFRMRPHNTLAALAAAFMLMLSPAYGTRAVATNCENDALGMFLVISSLFLFFKAYNRKKISYAFLCGLSFLFLRLAWGGSAYPMMSLGIFATLLAVVNFFHNKSTIEILPYLLIVLIMYQLVGFIAHEQGAIWHYHPMGSIEAYPVACALGASIVLEMFRLRRESKKGIKSGKNSIPTDAHHRIMAPLRANIKFLGISTIFTALAFSAFYSASIMGFINEALLTPTHRSVVHMTVAEQNPLAGSFSQFLSVGYNRYGIALHYALLMAPVLAYLVIFRASAGSLFLLVWGLPMMWATMHKAQLLFGSSASITALGATVGLLASADKKQLQNLRIVATLLLIFIPVFYVPLLGTYMYDKFVGFYVMRMGPSPDRYYWEPHLFWHAENTDYGDAIVTWWDYGHWITAVSRRPVLIDNLQADYHQIQDVARFFLNTDNEEEAVDILRTYQRAYERNRPDWAGIKYVSIDWTMIPKGSALHFIAQGDIDSNEPADPSIAWKNYMQCGFNPQMSQLEEVLEPIDGQFHRTQRIVFTCPRAAITFKLSGQNILSTQVYDAQLRSTVAWKTYSQSRDISLLGVQSLTGMYDRRLPSILQCARLHGQVPSGSICNMPQFRTLVLVPQEFNDYMLTRLYLGKHLEEYRELGLYNREPKPLRHFRLVPDYSGDGLEDGEFSFGYVRSFEVDFEGFGD